MFDGRGRALALEWCANGKARNGGAAAGERGVPNIRLAHHLAEHLSLVERRCERIYLELATHFAKVTGDWVRKYGCGHDGIHTARGESHSRRGHFSLVPHKPSNDEYYRKTPIDN
jgi:hypothetical protein